MNLSILALLAVLTPFPSISPMARVRSLYLSAPGSETACRELLAVTSGIDEKANPVQAGYHAAATMIMAKYFVNPVRKLVWFHDGEAL